MKIDMIAAAALAAIAGQSAFGAVGFREVAVTNAPFQMPAIRQPVFPERDFPITDFGARSGGEKCTEAFARAMEACSRAGGGRVVVPAGRWLTGAVRFRSNCDLHLAPGAVVEFSDDPADYPHVQTTWGGIECINLSPLVYAFDVENVAITGKGTLAPRMRLWQDWFARPPSHMKALETVYHWCSTNAPVALRDVTKLEGARMRPPLIQFNRSRNVLLEDFAIRESPLWTIHLYLSENCVARNLDMRARGHNNDGIDVEMTRNVLIEGCSLDQQDDGVCLKSGRNMDGWRLNRPTENVVVRNCRFIGAHTMLGIGSELSGGIRNIWMTRCSAASVGAPLRIKTNHRRGGFVEGVWFDNCSAGDVSSVFQIWTKCFYQWGAFPDYEKRYTRIRDIHFSDFTCDRAYNGITLKGDSNLKPNGIEIRNVTIGNVLESFTNVVNCENVKLEGVRRLRKTEDDRWAFSKPLPVQGSIAALSPGHAKVAEFLSKRDWQHMADGVYDLGDGAEVTIGSYELHPCSEAVFRKNPRHDMFLAAFEPVPKVKHYAPEWLFLGTNGLQRTLSLGMYAFIPANMEFADRLIFGNAQMRRRLVAMVEVGAQAGNAPQAKLDFDDATFEAAFSKVPAGHPRLMGGTAAFEAMKARLGKDELFTAAATAVKNHADWYASRKDVPKRKLHGRRLLTVCRDALSHISMLAMSYRLYGDRRYFDKCVAELRAVCDFTDWNPKHFLDVSEMSLAVAIGYDWLYHDLSEQDREYFAASLKRLGFDEFVRDAAKTKRCRQRAGNNWGQVCNCGAIAAALALWEREGDEARKLLKGAVQRLPFPMRVYAPNGCYPEGPGYWSYGTSFNVVAISLLEYACGTDFGLPTLPGFAETGVYRDWVTGPTGLMFNYSDSSLKRDLATPSWWFAHHEGNSTAIDFFERGALLATARNRRASVTRTFPCAMFWIRDMPKCDAKSRPKVWDSADPVGIAVMRDGWSTNSWFAAFKYGRVGGAHGHMDVGSFVLDANGVRWAGDIGSENYTRMEEKGITLWHMDQNSTRWSLYRLNNESHNLIVPEGTRQNIGSSGKLLSLSETPDGVCEAAFDLDAIYAPRLAGWRRRARVGASGTGLIVEDEVSGAKVPVSWGFATKAKVEVKGSTAVLSLEGRRMCVTLESPSGASWTAGPAAGKLKFEAPNTGWTRVQASTAPADRISFRIVFAPEI